MLLDLITHTQRKLTCGDRCPCSIRVVDEMNSCYLVAQCLIFDCCNDIREEKRDLMVLPSPNQSP